MTEKKFTIDVEENTQENALSELFSQKRGGKCFMQEQEWAFKKCMNCGGELELIKKNEFEEVKQCKDCGRKTLLLKKIREDEVRSEEGIKLIAKKFLAQLTPRCKECGSKLSHYWFYTENCQIQKCPCCGHINRVNIKK